MNNSQPNNFKIARYSGTLGNDHVFCFFSCHNSRHNHGSASTALQFGADHSIKDGWSGKTYAIPLFEKKGEFMPPHQLLMEVWDFFEVCINFPDKKFFMFGFSYLTKEQQDELTKVVEDRINRTVYPDNLYLPEGMVRRLKEEKQEEKQEEEKQW